MKIFKTDIHIYQTDKHGRPDTRTPHINDVQNQQPANQTTTLTSDDHRKKSVRERTLLTTRLFTLTKNVANPLAATGLANSRIPHHPTVVKDRVSQERLKTEGPSTEIGHETSSVVKQQPATPHRFNRLRGTSDKTSKTLANGYFNPDTVEEEAATLRACYLHEKLTGWPHQLNPNELHETIAKFKYLNEKERSEVVSLVLNLPPSEIRADAVDRLEFKWEYLSVQDQQKLTPSKDIDSDIASDAIKKRVASVYQEIEDTEEIGPGDFEKFKFLAKNIRLLSDMERQMLVMQAKWVKDTDETLAEKIAKLLLFQPEHLDIHINNLLGLLPNQQTLSPQMPSKPCNLDIFSERELLALKKWGNGWSGELNRGIHSGDMMDEIQELHDSIHSAFDKLKAHGFVHQGLVRKGILDAEAFDPGQYEIGKTFHLPIDNATTFFEKVSHLFTRSNVPYVHEYESKTGVDISSAIANFPDMLQQGEVVLKQATPYTIVEKGFDPSYIAGNCINGAYIVRFREN